MVGLEVKKGTPVKVLRPNSNQVILHITKKTTIFYREQVVIDPLGRLGKNAPQHVKDVAVFFGDHYGFMNDEGYTLMVHPQHVLAQ